MILADTSVVIDFLRSADASMRRIIVDAPAAVCGVTRAEVLHGARSPAERVGVVEGLSLFRQLPLPDSAWDDVGDLLASLRASGVAVPLADAVIASLAISHGIELWTRDAQFLAVQRVAPMLRLFPG
jgi:predicted nucleic acid-binding protein